jgi:hypothetical protein
MLVYLRAENQVDGTDPAMNFARSALTFSKDGR